MPCTSVFIPPAYKSFYFPYSAMFYAVEHKMKGTVNPPKKVYKKFHLHEIATIKLSKKNVWKMQRKSNNYDLNYGWKNSHDIAVAIHLNNFRYFCRKAYVKKRSSRLENEFSLFFSIWVLAVGEWGGYLFNSSVPLPPVSWTLRH